MTISHQHAREILKAFGDQRILVVGDLMLDRYIYGNVSRISPEAPVPVILQEGKATFTPGGAANVAYNLRSLGAKVALVGRIGFDQEGRLLIKELKKRGIATTGVRVDRTVPTAVKTRIIAQHQQVVRVDREKSTELHSGAFNKKIRSLIKRSIGSFDGIIISDYGKGMITSDLVSFICGCAIEKKKIITVDPKSGHFSYYAGVTAITPNRKELENAVHNIKITNRAGRRLAINREQLKTDADIDSAGVALLKFLKLESLLVTLGEAGMRLFVKGKRPAHIDTRAKEVFDVSGAGDTVIAVFTLSVAVGATKHQAADIANYAAGVVVGKTGAVPVGTKELLSAIKQ